MKILVVNAGSSSLKYQLFDMERGTALAKGICERIGIDGVITHKRPGKDDYKAESSLGDHKAAIELVLKLLCDSELGVISGAGEIGAVGHRIAHGGEKIRCSSILEEEEIKYLESIVERVTLDEMVLDKYTLKQITGALKDIKDIQALKSPLDIREQRARIAKLEKEANESNDAPTDITIRIEGGDESWQK